MRLKIKKGYWQQEGKRGKNTQSKKRDERSRNLIKSPADYNHRMKRSLAGQRL